MRKNSLENAAKYALERMEDHESRNNVSLGYDCGMSLLRDALGIPLTAMDKRNLLSVGYEITVRQKSEDPALLALQQIAESLGIDHAGLTPSEIGKAIAKENQRRVV
jgi:hypothetical protein